MCARPKRNYSEEFKEQAVELSRDPNLTIKQAAEKLGIRVDNLYRWRRLSTKDISNKPKGFEHPLLQSDSQELIAKDCCQVDKTEVHCVKHIKRKLKQLDFEKEVLTKALQIIDNK